MGVIFGREKRQAFPEPIIPPFYGGSSRPDGSPMFGRGEELGVPTVWACVGLLANAVSMLPLETFRRGPDGVPSRVADPALISTPAAGMTQSEWLHMLMVSLLLRGNAYGQIVSRDSLLRPTQIELLNPDAMTVEIDDDGNLRYLYGRTRKKIPNADVWHVRGLTLPGAKVGLSPIAYAAATLGVDLASRKFAGDFFAGGGLPKAVLTSDQSIDQPTARTIKQRLLEVTRNREPLVLGQGLQYTKMGVNPEESQFLATQHASVDQIARYFWVPATMVGGSAGSTMTYTSVEMQGIHFLTYSVSFWLKRLEDAMFGLLPSPQYVKFNADALMRTDAETRAKVNVQLLAGKVLTPTEVRATYERPPMTPAQKEEANLVPLDITPLGAPKGAPGLKVPPGPVAPTPAADQPV